ncbi:MAG: hypothetical protein Q9160_001220 [Pyrenula sp. 1 TL-2023]
MSDRFSYSRLDSSKGEIRLLTIQPSESLDDPVKCTLRVETLKPDLDFDALSYAWGNLARTFPIELDGKQICVTRNLNVALPRLRFYYGDTPRCIWIDAVSINQNDVQERSEQVQLMSKIFGTAAKVITWLGDYFKPESDATIHEGNETDSLRDVFHFLASRPEKPLWELDDQARKAIRIARVQELKETLSEKSLSLLKDILYRPYFSRLWVIQEIVLAKKLIALLGLTMISWYGLFIASVSITDSASLSHPGHPAYLYMLRDYFRNREKLNSEASSEGLQPTDIAMLRRSARYFHVSDNRDWIVALLGIASDREMIGFQPDYSLPEEAFVSESCKCYLNAKGAEGRPHIKWFTAHRSPL